MEQFSGIFPHSTGSFGMFRIVLAHVFIVCVFLQIDVSYGIANVTTKNFGHGGYLPSCSLITNQSECQIYNDNQTTCSFVAAAKRTDEDISVMRAWAAVTLRDNIISLLSAMIHKLNDDMQEHIYVSLDLLYQGALRHNLRTMELLSRLNPISKMKPTAQVVDIFKALRTAFPTYIWSVVDNLISTFRRRKEVLQSVVSMMEANGIDLFQDIGADLISRLQYRKTVVGLNKTVKAYYGKEFARFFDYVQRGRVKFTQPVFAALLLNMRFDNLMVEDVEDVRFLADNLRYGAIKNWNSSALCCDRINDPYDLVTKTLKSLSNSSDVDQKIRDIIETLQGKLVKPASASVNLHRVEMRNLMSGKELSNGILSEISRQDNDTAFQELVANGSLNVAYAMKGFIPSLYDHPAKVVLAFMRRVKNRVPMDTATEKLVSELTSRLRAKYADDSQGAVNESNNDTEEGSLPDVTKAKVKRSLGMKPDMESGGAMRCVNSLVDYTKKYLVDHNVIGRAKCAAVPERPPLSAWIQSLDTPATILEMSADLVKDVSEILGRTFTNNDVLLELWDRLTKSDRYQVYAPNDDGANASKNGTTLIETKMGQLAELLREMLTLKTIRQQPMAYHEMIRVYCISIGGCESDTLKRLSMDTRLDDRPHDSVIENLAGDFVSLPVRQLLEEQQFRRSLSGIRPEDYSTKRMLLIALFKRMLTLDAIRSDERIYNEVVCLLRSIHNLPIRFTDLIKTVTAGTGKEIDYARTIRTFLAQPNVLYTLGEDFNIGLFHTNGLMMKGLLSKVVSSPSVQKDFPGLPLAAQRMISKVDCSGYGAEAFQPVADVDQEYFVVTFARIEDGLKKVPKAARGFAEILRWCANKHNIPLVYY